MKDYSFHTFHEAKHDISLEERAAISGYNRRDISAMLQRDLTKDQQYWRTLTEAVQVLLHHPNNIVSHEAAFVLAAVPYRDEVHKAVAIRSLRYALRQRSSIVVQHESAEAMGELMGIASVGAAADLAKIIAFPEYHHPDVVQTAEEAFEHILAYIRAQPGWEKTADELVRWSTRDCRK